MGYSNSFELSIRGDAKVMVQFCEKCNGVRTGKFCSDCGELLIDKLVDVDEIKIFDELRKDSEECAFLLDEDGSSYEEGSGYSINDDIQKFSRKYPNIVFELNTTWDIGFDDAPSRDFYKNGKHQTTKTKVIFEDFNEFNLK